MRIVATSDCHGKLREADLPPGDVLVLAGDVLGHGGPEHQAPELDELDDWFLSLPYEKVVLVAGNHDWLFEKTKKRPENAIYLEESGVEIGGLEFYGAPHQPWFFNWAFNLPRDGPELAAVWDRIPAKTDVLITHGPPFGILDQVHGSKLSVGCKLLRERVRAVRPRVHIFGHIHEAYGRHFEDGTWFLNVSLCDEGYEPTQKPQVIDV